MLNGNGQEKSLLVHNRIFIEEDKEFSLDEFAHLVARAVRSVASVDIDKDKVVYSRDDVYFAIVDVLGYINERTPGRFKFDQTSFQSYLVHYIPNAIEKRKKTKGLVVTKAQSALHIKSITGELPVWASENPAIMEAITEIEDKPEAETSTHQNSAEAQQDIDAQVEKLAQTGADHYRQLGEIPASVTGNIEVAKRFHEILNTPQEETDAE